jgi:hypothetical protein
MHICSPMQSLSLNKNKYLNIISMDDFNRRTWAYFIRYKFEALIIIQQFKVIVEKQSGYVLKTLRTDRGGEFKSNNFDDY